jgi:predicted DNA-binding transcriptional regulator YafY
MSTSARMLRLLSLLQTHRYWPGNELAERLEVSPRTLRRDVERLRDLGYPVNADRGVGGGYQLGAGARVPPLLLDDEEAVAIAVGLRTAAGGSITGIEETSLRALAKLSAVMPRRLRHRVDALQSATIPSIVAGPVVEAATLMTLAAACRDDERLRFRYAAAQPAGAGGIVERTVEPHKLVSHAGRWYLVAWDLMRTDWRTFRVDRLTEPRATGQSFRQRQLPASDAAAFVRQAVQRLWPESARRRVEIRVHAPAGRVAAAVQRWASVESWDDASCTVRMEVDSLDWPVLLLSSIDADFEVTEPPELAAHLAATGARFLRAARNP